MRKWIAKRYASYTPSGKFWLTVGAICLTVDMAIGYLAGVSVGTFWHGVGYAALAAGFAFLPDAAYEEYEERRYIVAGVIAIMCIPIGVKAYEQQLTYSTGVRQGEMQAVGVQNTKYSGAQDDVKRNSAELAMLMAVREKMLADAPWAATVKADGLRSQASTLDKAIAQEGGKHNGGCKRKCLDLMAQKQEVEKRIAMAEKVEKDDTRIAELQAMIDKKRVVANNTKHEQSLNVDIAKTTAALVNLVRGAKPEDAINADETAIQYATLGSAGLGSLALLILAPVGFFLAGRRRIPGYSDHLVGPSGNRTPETSAFSSPIKEQDVTVPPIPRPRVQALQLTTAAQLHRMAAA